MKTITYKIFLEFRPERKNIFNCYMINYASTFIYTTIY